MAQPASHHSFASQACVVHSLATLGPALCLTPGNCPPLHLRAPWALPRRRAPDRVAPQPTVPLSTRPLARFRTPQNYITVVTFHWSREKLVPKLTSTWTTPDWRCGVHTGTAWEVVGPKPTEGVVGQLGYLSLTSECFTWGVWCDRSRAVCLARREPVFIIMRAIGWLRNM